MKRVTANVRLDVAPGEWLQGQWSFCEPRPKFAVVFLHGFTSVRYGEKAEALEAACARRDWTFATFDFRGHGESSGVLRDLRGSRLLADLDSVSAFLADKGVKRLCLVGSSMGGWVAAWYGRRHPERVVASAMIAPGFHFVTARWDRLDAAGREAWRRTGVLRINTTVGEVDLGYGLVEESAEFVQDDLLREYRIPTLIFHGIKDDVVPYTRSLAFIEQAADPRLELRLYKDGDHRLVDRKQEMAEAASGFFERWL